MELSYSGGVVIPIPTRPTILLMLLVAHSVVISASYYGTDENPAPGLEATNCPCGHSKAQKGRVIGGTRTLPHQYPWIVMLVERYDLEHICGASIINKRVAITAAHCTHPTYHRIPLSIIAGCSDVRNPGQIVPVSRYIEHEDFWSPREVKRMVNDIALLILARPLEFNPDVGPVCLPIGKVDLDDEWVRIIGWGKTGKRRPSTKNLMHVDVEAKSFDYCCKVYPFEEPQTQICMQTPGRGACMGDSGGPVVWLNPETNRYTLVGLVSFGSGDCNTQVPTAATEVSAFLPWIESKIMSTGCHDV